jgi:hypothetical protein
MIEELEGFLIQQDDFSDLEMLGDNFLDFVEMSSLDVIYIYFGNPEGDFIIAPEIDIPASYVFSERPPYTNAVEQGVFISEPYQDASTGEMVLTVSMAIYYHEEFIGVFAIDAFIPE